MNDCICDLGNVFETWTETTDRDGDRDSDRNGDGDKDSKTGDGDGHAFLIYISSFQCCKILLFFHSY